VDFGHAKISDGTFLGQSLPGFLSGFWPRGIEMRCNKYWGASGMILLEAKHMAN